MSRHNQDPEENSLRLCAVKGCDMPGEFKAPKSRHHLSDYQWLCLEHIREFNKTWNYFEGMESEEIEHFMQDALTGHRPTWQREELGQHSQSKQYYSEVLHNGLNKFFNWDDNAARQAALQKLPAKERRALITLDLSARCTLPQLKSHFRALVKLHHPDLHPGDKEQEERFKKITAAYEYLSKHYA